MSRGADVVPVTVAIPTIGRLEPLGRCLESLSASDPMPDEILVVDQSHAPAVVSLVDEVGGPRARVVPSHGLGVARARNDGLRAAANDVVLVTDDDCTVSPDWVLTAARLAGAHPGAIVTGRVLPVGDPRAVPSTKDDPVPVDLSDERRGGWLFGNNMVLPRRAVLDLGGFDERFGPEEAAEDNEFCYRWLKARRTLRYEPSLVVEHHDWRSPEDLERLYVRYARGEGFFYAKHLRGGDLRMLRFVARDLVWGMRGLASGLVKGRESWTDSRRGVFKGMPGGFAAGWRTYGRER
ncbi:MAG: glycosyltransferase family 2 protein [Gaiellaceae bacterium]